MLRCVKLPGSSVLRCGKQESLEYGGGYKYLFILTYIQTNKKERERERWETGTNTMRGRIVINVKEKIITAFSH